MRFSNKVAVVTGAASGVGAATVERLRSEGATVVGLDVQSAEGVTTCNVTDENDVNSTFEHIIDQHGRIDVVCNVAGILRMGSLDQLTSETWNQVIAVNLTGPFLVSKAAMPHLLNSSGNLVNVASISGLHGQPYNAAYCASKGGLVQLTRSLAVEYARRGVRVNCVCPGGVDTPMTQGEQSPLPADADMQAFSRMMSLMPGFIDPAEIAGAIAYLASDDARSISGTSLVVDRATLCA